MRLSANLLNSGNTPAEFKRFRPTYQLPKGWTQRKEEWVASETTPVPVGPKSQVAWQYHQNFTLGPEAFSNFVGGSQPILYLSGDLSYEDVFGKEHRINWDWGTFANQRNNGEVFRRAQLTLKKVSQ